MHPDMHLDQPIPLLNVNQSYTQADVVPLPSARAQLRSAQRVDVAR